MNYTTDYQYIWDTGNTPVYCIAGAWNWEAGMNGIHFVQSRVTNTSLYNLGSRSLVLGINGI